jgi:hypothetical protein
MDTLVKIMPSRTMFSYSKNRLKKKKSKSKKLRPKKDIYASSSSSSSTRRNYSPGTLRNRDIVKLSKKTYREMAEAQQRVTQLQKDADALFKKKHTTVKENMDIIQIKNLNTGKVSQAFVLSESKGKSQLLYIDNNKAVGKDSL